MMEFELYHIEHKVSINPLNCLANQLSGFYMRTTLAFNGLNNLTYL